MEVEIMLSLITIDTENCKSDFCPYYLDTTLRMSKEEEEEESQPPFFEKTNNIINLAKAKVIQPSNEIQIHTYYTQTSI